VPTPVRVRFGESVSEAMGTPNNDHAVHDWHTQVARMGRTEVGETGFRFVRIDLPSDSQRITLRKVLAVFLYRPVEYLGSFECSDPRLNAIWRTGAYTVHLNMQDHIWDGIKRDRWVWIGDLHPEAMVVSTVFGQHPIVPETMDYQRDRTPLPHWMNGIASYSLWWIILQRDWYRHWADRQYLVGQREYLLGLLTQVEGFLDADGVEQIPNRRFLEWPTSEDPTAIDAGHQALVTIALQAGAELCAVLGETEAAGKADAAATRAAKGQRPFSASKQANALRVLAGMADAEEVNREILAVDPFRGISTFYGYYVLQSRALAGDFSGCLDLIRTYWGGMLDMGATSFWEGFEIDWMPGATRIDEMPTLGKPDIHADFGMYCYQGLRHSLCHGWAAGPTAWLTEHVLGLAPATPGCAEITVNPHLGDLAWARGTLPTPQGLVEVMHERLADGTIRSDIRLPGGVRRKDN
jgi:alpha-L-rhamnosidase